MGVAKAWLRLRDQPILEHLRTRLEWRGPTLLVTAPGREHPPACDLFTREVIDAVADEGPLRGLLTAVQNSTTDIIVAATCDMPLVRREQLLWLADRLESGPSALGMMFERDVENRRQVEPFPCAVRKAAGDVIERAIQSDQLSVHSLAKLPRFPTCNVPAEWAEESWLNLNRPEELERFVASQAPSSSDRKCP